VIVLSTPHPTDAYAQHGIKLSDEQFAIDAAWRDRGDLRIEG